MTVIVNRMWVRRSIVIELFSVYVGSSDHAFYIVADEAAAIYSLRLLSFIEESCQCCCYVYLIILSWQWSLFIKLIKIL